MLARADGGDDTRLYVLPGSHPCAAVEAAWRRRASPQARGPGAAVAAAGRPLRYGARPFRACASAPSDSSARAGSCAASTSWSQSRHCCRPWRPAYARVLEAERWGDEVFQPVPRRLLDASFLRAPSTIESFGGEAKLPLPAFMLRPALPLTARMMAFRNKASDANARADLAALPRQLERIDGWIAEGLLGGERPTRRTSSREPDSGPLMRHRRRAVR